jgi:hypothetical protein
VEAPYTILLTTHNIVEAIDTILNKQLLAVLLFDMVVFKTLSAVIKTDSVVLKTLTAVNLIDTIVLKQLQTPQPTLTALGQSHRTFTSPFCVLFKGIIIFSAQNKLVNYLPA